MAVTEYGKELRKIRIDRSEILKDMADRLNITSAYLSAIEIGKRTIPSDMTEKIIEKYHLNEIESSCLKAAEDKSLPYVKMDMTCSTDLQRQTAIVFARRFEELDDERAVKILSLLNKEDK